MLSDVLFIVNFIASDKEHTTQSSEGMHVSLDLRTMVGLKILIHDIIQDAITGNLK